MKTMDKYFHSSEELNTLLNSNCNESVSHKTVNHTNTKQKQNIQSVFLFVDYLQPNRLPWVSPVYRKPLIQPISRLPWEPPVYRNRQEIKPRAPEEPPPGIIHQFHPKNRPTTTATIANRRFLRNHESHVHECFL